MRDLQQRCDLDTSRVDDILIGCVSPVWDQGSDIARLAALYAGWDTDTPGVQLDRFCGSGLESVNSAAMKVRSGWDSLIVAGGVEMMSRVPLGSSGGAWSNDPETAFITRFVPQGVSADIIATLEGFSRDDVDEFATMSHQRAAEAMKNGYFSPSMAAVKDMNGFVVLDRDELVRPETSTNTLAGLKPSFLPVGELGYDSIATSKYKLDAINHVHTAGNSSAIADGAALVLIGNEKIATELGLTPRARIIACAVSGSDPCIMLTGLLPATEKALSRAGMNISQIDLFEVNEAFASVPLLFSKHFDVPLEKINVNGGAIAMGHPLGATGSILIGTILDELTRRNLRYGLCTACIGAGMGIATIVERI